MFVFELLLIFASVAITNNFECEQLDPSVCEEVGYCYLDGFSFDGGNVAGSCKKDLCLGVATSNASSGNGCAAGCNVATLDFFELDDQCELRFSYVYICTSRTYYGRHFDDCFAGMVLSNGVCSKSIWGDINSCKNISVANDGSTLGGEFCGRNVDYGCNEVGAANCKMVPDCALVGGVCVRDSCPFSEGGTSSCRAADGCSNYTVYDYSGSGSSYTISTYIVCAVTDKYGSGTTPDPCAFLPTRDYDSNWDEDPCNSWNYGDPMPANTAHCTVIPQYVCGSIYDCRSECYEDTPSNCTSASGIAGVTCSVQTNPYGGYGYTFCSDGRTFAKNDTNNNNSRAAVVMAVRWLAVVLAAVLLGVFAN